MTARNMFMMSFYLRGMSFIDMAFLKKSDLKNGYLTYRRRKTGQRLIINMPLTMYVARHSWASAAKAKGIPVSVISEEMGHDSESTTQIYLSSLDSSVVDSANSIILDSLK